MVYFVENLELTPETPLRVRAQYHRYMLGVSNCSKSSKDANLRQVTYDESNQLESCSKDPMGLTPDDNTYRLAEGNPHRWIDPYGLLVVDPFPRDVDGCIRLLQGVVIGTTVFPEVDGSPSMPCARSLLKLFLAGTARGTTCTSECREALSRYDWTSKFGEFASEVLRSNFDCGFKGRIDLSDYEFDFRKGRDGFEKDDDFDLYNAFHEFTMATIEAACDVNCPKATGCCCTCSGKCGGEIIVKDDYDFCSSLGPTPGPFARCGCQIEKYRKAHGSPSGGTFKVRCSAGHRTELSMSARICYPKDPYEWGGPSKAPPRKRR